MNRRLLSAVLTVSLLLGVCWLAARPAPEGPGEKPAVGPTWWKGNLHTHTLWSDGDDFPENVAAWYREHGYHFLALTDHNKLSEGAVYIDAAREKVSPAPAIHKATARFGDGWVQYMARDGKVWVKLKALDEVKKQLEVPGKFLLIQAEEITGSFNKMPIHMNAINVDKVIQPLVGQTHEETIRINLRQVSDQAKASKNKPMLGFLNHPNFGWGVRAEDMAPIDELGFFEVFNGHSGVRNYGDEEHASTERMWDILLALRLGKLKLPLIHGLATDDSHGYHAFGIGKINPGRGWVMVRADKLEAGPLVQAIQAGDFYASTGVVLDDVRHANGELIVSIRPEAGVTYTTEVIGTLKGVSLESEPVKDAEGKELAVTRRYSADIGKVLAKSNEPTVRYKLTGQELYVRVKVTSSKPHPNPYAKGDFETAWVPPVVP
jgi:hypothetical protein